MIVRKTSVLPAVLLLTASVTPCAATSGTITVAGLLNGDFEGDDTIGLPGNGFWQRSRAGDIVAEDGNHFLRLAPALGARGTTGTRAVQQFVGAHPGFTEQLEISGRVRLNPAARHVAASLMLMSGSWNS